MKQRYPHRLEIALRRMRARSERQERLLIRAHVFLDRLKDPLARELVSDILYEMLAKFK